MSTLQAKTTTVVALALCVFVLGGAVGYFLSYVSSDAQVIDENIHRLLTTKFNKTMYTTIEFSPDGPTVTEASYTPPKTEKYIRTEYYNFILFFSFVSFVLGVGAESFFLEIRHCKRIEIHSVRMPMYNSASGKATFVVRCKPLKRNAEVWRRIQTRVGDKYIVAYPQVEFAHDETIITVEADVPEMTMDVTGCFIDSIEVNGLHIPKFIHFSLATKHVSLANNQK